jgi:glucose-6-phosphate dehydrogenase assembly protein OpcA
MPAIANTYSLGSPVEIGKIDKELKKLWSGEEGAMTRASLMNLAVYSEEQGSLEKNTQVIAELTKDHACRAIVIEGDPGPKEDHVDAWVNAHCHVRSGNKQVCSEQLSFRLKGPCTRLLPNIVFSHLDSDLPFYLWWQGELPESMDPQLWPWVDRFIYDSHTWQNFEKQFGQVETAQREAKQRIILCDLNWTRLDRIRMAIAQFFDHPSAHYHFAEVEKIEATFAAGFRSTALLFAGWFAAQLKWRLESNGAADHIRFATEEGHKIDIELVEAGRYPLDRILIKSRATEFHVSHADCGDKLEISRDYPGERLLPQLMPAQADTLVELMSQELLRGGQRLVYLRAVNCIRSLL